MKEFNFGKQPVDSFYDAYHINPWQERQYFFNVIFNEEILLLKEYKQAVKAEKEEEYDIRNS